MASISWNFKDNAFKNLGTITSTITVNNLTMTATSEKSMSVIQNTQTVGNAEYTYCLALEGTGSPAYRNVKIPVSGASTIKVTLKSSGSSARTLVAADEKGVQFASMTAAASAATQSCSYNGPAGYIYLYSAGSGINIYKIQADSRDDSQAPSDGQTVSSYNELVSAVSAAEKAGGGTVYVKGGSISCSGQIKLSAKNAGVSIIGLKNSDGSYPVLDFAPFMASYIGVSTSDAQVGIRITGSGYTIKNLIVQKAPDNGIQIKGSAAGNNTVEDCIIRYNNDAGLQITGGAHHNTIRFVYSYRNCDVYTLGGNADGFAPKLAAGTGNTFYGCYAWDNSDDGWDSYDKTDGLTPDLSYEECAVWNNGNPAVFTGEYDFKNKNKLDTNLLLVDLIMKKDAAFAKNYADGKFSLPSGSFIKTTKGTVSISAWTGSDYDGNPNGFKYGSVNSTSACVRTIKNCLAFDHTSKGFDNNNSACTAYFTNCVAFDNGYNYYFAPFTIKSFRNIVGFAGKKGDKLPSGYNVTTPDSKTQSSIRSKVSAAINQIVSNCSKNIIKEIYFDIYS